MEQDSRTVLPDGCMLLQGISVADERGVLTFVEGGTLPFAIARIFWITSVPGGKSRGGHAHASCSEAVFAVRGSFTMHLSDGRVQSATRISSPGGGILVPAGIWCDLRDFTPDCVCVVAASHPYDAEGYINGYGDYLAWRNGSSL